MSNIVFSGQAKVELQGDRVLRFVNKDDQKAQYQLLGFEQSPVHVVDYRRSGIRAVEQVLETGDASKFPGEFNMPAHVTLSIPENHQLQIELRESNELDPSHMLWVAIGLQNEIPVYDYVYSQAAPFTDSALAFLSIYRRPGRP